MSLLGGKPAGISSGKTWANDCNKAMAREWFREVISGSSRLVRIQSLKDLNSCQAALKSGSLKVRNRSDRSGFFVEGFLWSWEGDNGVKVIFLPFFVNEYVFR